MKIEWYRKNKDEIFKIFNSNPDRGLTESRVLDLRNKYGENVLKVAKAKTLKEIFISQFKSPLIYVLLVASAIVFLLKDYSEAIIIFSIVILNSIIGTFQEGKAQNTLAALSRLVKSYVTVIREGEEKRISDSDLVPGDIILLKDGEAVGADARLIESNSIKANESALTGESTPVEKTSEQINAVGLNVSDQQNMIFRGTYIISGIGKAIVVEVGHKTVVGQIASKLTKLEIDVPLKRNISNLSKLLVSIIIFIATITFFYGLYVGYEFKIIFSTVVALSVSAIPEGLPVVVTIVLASGVWRMSKKNVLVKRLQAVEALGQAKVIALDKTGTITKNQMTVERIYTDNNFYSISGIGYEPVGKIFDHEEKEVDFNKNKAIDLFLKISVFTAIAEIHHDKEKGEWLLDYGDPTEAALLVLGMKNGIFKEKLINEYKQIHEIPFSTETKYHATTNKINNNNFFSIAGGPEVILSKCDKILISGTEHKLDEEQKTKLEKALKKLSGEGYRILALAYKENVSENITNNDVDKLVFLGYAGITDAIRPNVKKSVDFVKASGIKVLMITGDHAETAQAIAQKVGIYKTGDKVLTGSEMSELSDRQLISIIDRVTVFARVTPNDKLRIIEMFKKKGQTIAMTGDGVNDALSLVAADLGVSMGKMGTEVAREASDIVLLDDNFENVVAAAEEGRNIYWTIRKTIAYLLSTNLGEVLVIVVAVFIGIELPLLATQIIWLNLVTDTFLVSSLAFNPKEKNLLKEKFIKTSKYIIDKIMIYRILLVGFLMSTVTLLAFTNHLDKYPDDIVKAQTIALTLLVVFQCYNIFNISSFKNSVFSKDIFNNKYSILGILASMVIHSFAIYHPFMQNLLGTTGLSGFELLMIIITCFSVVIVEEIRKFIYRRYSIQS